jgi:hypothetical protein
VDEFGDTRTMMQRVSNLLSGDEPEVEDEGEVMRTDARI